MNAQSSVTQFLDDATIRQQVLGQYQKDGYAILSGLFDSSAVHAMQDVWQRIGNERQAAGKKPFATLLMPHISYPDIRKVTSTPALIKTIEFFLGGKIELIQSQLMHGTPGTKGFSPHQDNYYNRASPPDGIIAAWIAVEDVDETNGGVAVYPGSHTGGLVQARRDWLYLMTRAPDILKSLLRLMKPELRKQSADSGVIERFVYAAPSTPITPVVPSLTAGSVLLMHGDLIHASGPNKTADRFRRSLLTNYVRKGTYYSSGKLSGRISVDVYADSNDAKAS